MPQEKTWQRHEELPEGFQSVGKARHREMKGKQKKGSGKGGKTRNEVTKATHGSIEKAGTHRCCCILFVSKISLFVCFSAQPPQLMC